MGREPLQSVSVEKDIGVQVCDNLKPGQQCIQAAKPERNVLYQLLRSFHYRDKRIFKNLYVQYVRPHLEFACPAWSPWNVGDIEILEKVQEKFVKKVRGLHGVSYSEKLKGLDLCSLSERRLQLDLIECFKIVNGINKVNYSTWFELIGDSAHRHTRNSDYAKNLVKPRVNLDV